MLNHPYAEQQCEKMQAWTSMYSHRQNLHAERGMPSSWLSPLPEVQNKFAFFHTKTTIYMYKASLKKTLKLELSKTKQVYFSA